MIVPNKIYAMCCRQIPQYNYRSLKTIVGKNKYGGVTYGKNDLTNYAILLAYLHRGETKWEKALEFT